MVARIYAALFSLSRRKRILILILMGLAGLAVLVVLAHAALGSTSPTLATITLHVGRDPVALVMDDQARRAFVSDDASDTVSVLDVGNGTLLTSIGIGGGITGEEERLIPTRITRGVAGHVLVVDLDSSLSVIDERNGHILRTVVMDAAPIAVAIDARRGRALLASPGDGGSVRVVDIIRGLILRTISLPEIPSTVAVDARTGHVLVGGDDSAGGVVSILDATRGRVLRTIRVGRFVRHIDVDV